MLGTVLESLMPWRARTQHGSQTRPLRCCRRVPKKAGPAQVPGSGAVSLAQPTALHPGHRHVGGGGGDLHAAGGPCLHGHDRGCPEAGGRIPAEIRRHWNRSGRLPGNGARPQHLVGQATFCSCVPPHASLQRFLSMGCYDRGHDGVQRQKDRWQVRHSHCAGGWRSERRRAPHSCRGPHHVHWQHLPADQHARQRGVLPRRKKAGTGATDMLQASHVALAT